MTSDFTPEQRQAYELALAASAQGGDDVQAVCDFGELVFGKAAAAHHRAWVEEILAHKRVGIVAPPQSAKTTWVTIILMAWWIGKHPEHTNAIASAGDDAAKDMAQAVAETIENNPKWKLVFPNVVPDKARGWSSDGYNVMDTRYSPEAWSARRAGDKNPTLVGGGVGNSVFNGLRVTGLFDLDDMHDRRSKTQQATCDDTVGFFKDTAEYRVTPEGHLAIMQTRWNRKDVIAYVKGRKDFTVFEHPAIQVGESGECSYWPELWPLERLADIRERGPVEFELVFQGNDAAVEGTVLKAEWLHEYPPTQILDRWNRYFGIDFARRVKEILGKNDDPDHFALAVVVDTGTRLVVEDGFDGVLFMAEAEEKFFSLAGTWRPRISGVETNGIGNEYYLNLLKQMRLRGLSYVLRPLRTRTDKGERLSQMAGYFASGQVMVSSLASPFLETFRGEWVSFPRGHDDALDAVYFAWLVASHLLPAGDAATRRLSLPEHSISVYEQIERAYA